MPLTQDDLLRVCAETAKGAPPPDATTHPERAAIASEVRWATIALGGYSPLLESLRRAAPRLREADFPWKPPEASGGAQWTPPAADQPVEPSPRAASSGEWVQYKGPLGGKGWKHSVTGRVFYGDKQPGAGERGVDPADVAATASQVTQPLPAAQAPTVQVPTPGETPLSQASKAATPATSATPAPAADAAQYHSLPPPPKDKPVTLVFGGSFSPIHLGHIATAEKAKQYMESLGYKVAKVILAPTADKLLAAKLGPDLIPLAQRTEMAKLAAKEHPDIEVSDGAAKDAEAVQGKLRRTQLADWAGKNNPGTTVINVTGSDAAPGHPTAFPSVYSGDKGSNHDGYYYMALPREEGPQSISSTKIRNAIKTGGSIGPDMMNPEAEAYFRQYVASKGTAAQPPVPNSVGPPAMNLPPPGSSLLAQAAASVPHIRHDATPGKNPARDAWKRGERLTIKPVQPKLTPEQLKASLQEIQVKHGAVRKEQVETDRMYTSADRPARPDGKPGDADMATLSPQRKQLHDKILADYANQAKPQAQPVFVVMGGGTASGKSTLVRSGVVKLPPDAVKIDADEIKSILPEYAPMMAAGNIKAAAAVHEESSYLTKQAMNVLSERKANTILDGTGNSSLEKLKAKVDKMRARGYQVVAEYVTIPTALAINQMIQRGNDEGPNRGRYVDEAEMRRNHASVSKTLPEAIKAGIFDSVNLWDVSGDGSPVLVVSAKGKQVQIHNPQLWDQFLAKANE